MSTIDSFTKEFFFLSNFSRAKVTLDGEVYPTTEHAYQAAKTLDPEIRSKIRDAKRKEDGSPWPGEAKRMGARVALRPDWEDVKLKVMEDLLRQKFSDPALSARLKATGDKELIEGNTWKDRFWGVYMGKGENHLGKLLMKIREELPPLQAGKLP